MLGFYVVEEEDIRIHCRGSMKPGAMEKLESGWSRRSFLATATGMTVCSRAALSAVRGASQTSMQEAIAREKRRMLQLNGYAIDAETPLDALTTYLTPNDLFFVRHHWNPMYPSARTWALAIDGEVERPLSLNLGDLKRLPRTTVTCVLQCAGNSRSLHKPP